MTEPKFEEYTPAVQVLKNGKTFAVADRLVESRRRYLETRMLYNLRQRTQTQKPRILSQPKNIKIKYTVDECIWIIDHTIEEIMTRYNAQRSQVYGMRFYARRVLGR